jgi:hypothetical protein
LGNVTDPHPPSAPELVEMTGALRELTALLARAVDLVDALEVLAEMTLRTVPEATRCGLIVLRDGEPALVRAAERDDAGEPYLLTTVGSAPMAAPADEALEPSEVADLDETQCRVGEGPGLSSMRDRELVAVADLADEDRWPLWTPRCVAAGMRSVVCLPLDVSQTAAGALSLYSPKPHALANSAQLVGLLLAEHGSLLLSTVLDRQMRAAQAAELSAALHGDSPVAHAVGIVMAQRGCDADAALDVLTSAAIRANLNLNVVADRLVAAVARRGNPEP